MSNRTAILETPARLNGLDINAAMATIAALKADPSLARFQFRARNRWINGGENRSVIRDFYGAGQEDSSRTSSFEFTNGEPPVLLGNNEGANPVEFLLHALAGCVTTTFVLHAMARGIAIRELSTELAGDLDLRGLLALDDAVPAGYEQIRIRMHVKADCSERELDDLLAAVFPETVGCLENHSGTIDFDASLRDPDLAANHPHLSLLSIKEENGLEVQRFVTGASGIEICLAARTLLVGEGKERVRRRSGDDR